LVSFEEVNIIEVSTIIDTNIEFAVSGWDGLESERLRRTIECWIVDGLAADHRTGKEAGVD
jgi:hypothetical protein